MTVNFCEGVAPKNLPALDKSLLLPDHLFPLGAVPATSFYWHISDERTEALLISSEFSQALQA